MKSAIFFFLFFLFLKASLAEASYPNWKVCSSAYPNVCLFIQATTDFNRTDEGEFDAKIQITPNQNAVTPTVELQEFFLWMPMAGMPQGGHRSVPLKWTDISEGADLRFHVERAYFVMSGQWRIEAVLKINQTPETLRIPYFEISG